ncbi:hypothetical protein Leryth_026277, partial [Lithospermum erythrorhizon]
LAPVVALKQKTACGGSVYQLIYRGLFFELKGWNQVVMVSQAAGQTRFRTLKHENGIAGSAAIVIRVIVCFQPLQDCQAEYFRQLLKPVT